MTVGGGGGGCVFGGGGGVVSASEKRHGETAWLGGGYGKAINHAGRFLRGKRSEFPT